MVWLCFCSLLLLLGVQSSYLVGNLRLVVAGSDDDNNVPPTILRDEIVSPSEELIELQSPEGKSLFGKMLHNAHSDLVLPLLANLETQMNLGACAPASACTVLNTLEYKLPYDPTYSMFDTVGYAHWTQDYFILDECVKQVVGPKVFGQTLASFGRIMQCIGLNVDCQHGNQSSNPLTQKLQRHFELDGHVVVANFQRSVLHQPAGGHFSPLAGMVNNRVLVLDVARYKYYPVFASVHDMVKSMMTFDEQSQAMRGFCAVWK
ncbi:hypothetical protein BASA82_000052 [Batrachochytrium salamandrivorans]|nr:hypothetical protein BASA81_000323 [Batrachochytrium salamandrivorans]KAH9262937.1 hypothetical protein BASA82_000052 [Batrachochytrium salamandrivorans]